jgi:hypothetical protein
MCIATPYISRWNIWSNAGRHLKFTSGTSYASVAVVILVHLADPAFLMLTLCSRPCLCIPVSILPTPSRYCIFYANLCLEYHPIQRTTDAFCT